MSLLRQSLAQVSDPRRAQGKRYDLPHVLLYSVLAVASGATSYRKIEQFLQAHWQSLNEAFGSRWKRAPAYTGLRKILQGLDAAELEAALRREPWRPSARIGRPCATRRRAPAPRRPGPRHHRRHRCRR